MVDATTRQDAPKTFARTAKPAGGGAIAYSVRVESALGELAPGSIVAPAQQPQWLAAWSTEVNGDTLVASLFDASGQPVFALPLEVVRAGSLKIARFAGGSHANGNFPIVRPANALPATALDKLVNSIRAARPDIDVLALERMAPDVAGIANPLLPPSARQSPNVALAVNLEGGFDAMLERSPSRKARRHRAQARKFESLGGARRFVANTEAEVGRCLDAFFAMKAARFRSMGIADVFAEPRIQAFFRSLFRTALGSDTFTLSALEVAGTLRAVTGHSRCGDRLICEFGAIADDEMAVHSPGDFLFYENIRAACEDGFSFYDFSVGDEPYKRAWCDIEQHQVDMVLPLTWRGRLYARWLNAKSALKGQIKSSPMLWPMAKRLRRLLRGHPG